MGDGLDDEQTTMHSLHLFRRSRSVRFCSAKVGMTLYFTWSITRCKPSLGRHEFWYLSIVVAHAIVTPAMLKIDRYRNQCCW